MANKRPSPVLETELAHFTPRQMEAAAALDCRRYKFLLYGGALGGGKSYLLRWYAIRRLYSIYKYWGIKKPVAMLACEDYPSLKDRQLTKIGIEFPYWLGKLNDDHKIFGRCFILANQFGGGVICFRNLDDPSKYASAEFCLILVDELTKNKYDVFTHLRTRLRWPGMADIDCQFVAGSNPGSIGHNWVKQLWMDKDFPEEWIYPIDYRSMFHYIPSKADDNPYLDSSYWNMLSTLPEHLRKAFKDGDWDVFLGQAFPEFSRQIHVIDPIPIPENAPIYMSFDWGFGAPFSLGWYWVDNDNRLYRFLEWYGWNGTPNEGLRLTDPQIARGLLEKEKELRDKGLYNFGGVVRISRYAGPDCFAKKPDYKGGGQGPSTADEFFKATKSTPHPVILSKGDPSRALKIRQFRERLRVPEDYPKSRPMIQVYSTCKQFIRTIPSIMVDPLDIEDVDTKGEDHIYDETALVCMARPLSLKKPKERKSYHDRRIERLIKGTQDPYERAALHDQALTMDYLQRGGHNAGPEDEFYGEDHFTSFERRNDISIPTMPKPEE